MKRKNIGKMRLMIILIISLFVIATGSLFATQAFKNGNIVSGILSILISLTIIGFAIFVYRRGIRDIKEGYPLKDERSRKVIEKASSMAFYVTIYLLLAIGFLSDDLIPFRDVSQATSLAVAGMVILFVIFWAYYNKKELWKQE